MNAIIQTGPFFAKLLKLVNTANGILWDYILIFLLVGTGIFFTVLLKGVQIRQFWPGLKSLFRDLRFKRKKKDQKESKKEGLTSFQALTTALAAQVGTGNIAGAATAIAAGGAGAIFWMWVSAFFGMATIYAETLLAQKTRVRKDGHILGGPAYYIKARFKGRFGTFLAGFFSVATILALGFMGNMVQANSISVSFQNAFAVPPIAIGLAVALAAAMIIFGGLKRIGKITEMIVPFMALLYLIGGLIIIFMNADNILPTFRNIFVGAFSPSAVIGGVAGVTVKKAVRYGVARGLFSNEAGMGSTPHSHATAEVNHPTEQGVLAIIGVFFDTFVILTVTALVILVTNSYTSGLTGSELAQFAFKQSFGHAGTIFIAISMLLFAFTTILGWYYFGEVNVRRLFGNKAVKIYAALVLCCVILGSLMKVDLVWEASDLFNGLMVLPNLIALLGSAKIVLEVHKEQKNGLLKRKSL